MNLRLRDFTPPAPLAREGGATKRLRRVVLGVAGLAMFAAGPVVSSCATGFDPPSEVNTLRILAVTADKPYAQPNDDVTFEMTLYDGKGDADGIPRPIQITWLGGCFSPEGDQYFQCYPQLADVIQDVASGNLPPEGLVAQGVGLNTFTLHLPEDIISRRPPPKSGPYVGVAFLFFTACAGEVRPIPPSGTSDAGSFPLGCFEVGTGRRLGPESFVPGYTQIFAFEDKRKNANPEVIGAGMTIDGRDWPEGTTECAEVCPITEQERQEQGCAAKDPEDECTTLDIKVQVPSNVAETDPGSGQEGEALTEVVWVRYYSDGGDISGDTKLINDAVQGFQDGFEMTWVPPETPGAYNIWAVVHDARGGATVVRRDIQVVEAGQPCTPSGGGGAGGGGAGGDDAGGSGGTAGSGGAGGTSGGGGIAGSDN